MSVFGQWLKERRRAADLTQAELAERVGCSPIMIAKIESGERRPSKQIAELLARRLRIPPAQVEAFITFARGQTDIAPAPDPAPTPASAFGGLPATALVGRLIGREREMQQLAGYLRDPQTRLVTLTGPGGVGKTQLAARAAHAARAHFERGVCFVDASTCLNADDLTRSMARALRVNEGPDAVLPVIVACLTPLNLLLALDNLEQVEGAVEVVAELLAHCPRVWMLVTSREALRLRGERVFPVPPLATPITVRGEGASTAELMAIPSVRLFVERAQAANPGFHLDSNNARAVAELCRRLDGLPLALELAAARVSLMTPQALLGWLAPTRSMNAEEARADEVRIDVIAGDNVEVPARQRALRNAIQWSYDLLDPAGQSVFRRLGVFSGSFTLDAAEAVLRAENDSPTAAWEAVSTQLSHSLLQRRDAGPDGETRFAQLETIRAFARQQLDTSGEAAQTQRRHAGHYLHAAETGAALIAGSAQQDALTRLEADYSNIRAALRWLLQHDPPRALRLAASLIPFWDTRGYFHEGRQMLAWALSAGNAPTADRAQALIGLGLFDFNRSAFQSALRHCDEALSICDSLGDAQGLIAEAWLVKAMLAEANADLENARRFFDEALVAARQAQDTHTLARIHTARARFIRVADHDLDAADATLNEALELHRQLGNRRGMAHALMQCSDITASRGEYTRAVELAAESAGMFRALGALNELGLALMAQGESQINAGLLDDAQATLDEALTLFEQIGGQWCAAISRHHLGRIALQRGDLPAARSLLLSSLAASRALGRMGMVARCVVGLAGLALAEGQPERAAQLLGAAMPRLPADLTPADLAEIQGYAAAARRALGGAGYAAATSHLELDQAIAEVCAGEESSDLGTSR